MTVFRIDKNKNYTVMSNYHLRDRNLSLKAKGLLSFMLSLPEDWDYSLKGLITICKENRDAIKNALDELKDNKYLKIERFRNQNGTFEYNYIIFEEPFKNRLKMQNSPDTGFPYMDKPYLEEPYTEKQLQINTKEINTNKINIKEQIDKKDNIDILDKETIEKPIKHNYLTLELFNLGYIKQDDDSSFLFDDLFREYIDDKVSYKRLYSIVHYVVSNVIRRDYKDENGKDIENKYGYLKSAIDKSLEYKKLSEMATSCEYEELYPDDDNSDFYKDAIKDFERWGER